MSMILTIRIIITRIRTNDWYSKHVGKHHDQKSALWLHL